MEKSNEIGEIAQAIAHVQEKLEPLVKDKTGQIGHRSYKYADLSQVWETLQGLCAEAGLAVTTWPTAVIAGTNVVPCLDILLMHTQSGQFIQNTMPLCLESNDPQAQGSAITYARRYMLSAVFQICADEDDDAASAMPAMKQPEWKPPAPAPMKSPPPPGEKKPELLTPAQLLDELRRCQTKEGFIAMTHHHKASFEAFDAKTQDYVKHESAAILETLDSLPF